MEKAKKESQPPNGSQPAGNQGPRSLNGEHLQSLDARGAQITGWELRNALCTDGRLEHASLKELVAPESHWIGLRASESQWQDCDLRGATFVRCNFEGAVFERVKLDGADLRGCSLRGAWLKGVDFSEARIQGADFRDAGGLEPATVTALLDAGAKTGSTPVAKAISTAFPKSPSLESHRTHRRAVAAFWAALSILLPLLFFGRAILSPIHPESPPGYEDQASQEFTTEEGQDGQPEGPEDSDKSEAEAEPLQ